MGIAYSAVGNHEGPKARIESAYKIKEHFEVLYLTKQSYDNNKISSI